MDHRNTLLLLAILLAFGAGAAKLMQANAVIAQDKASGINLYIAANDWNLAEKNPASKPEDDDFVAHIQTPEVPSKEFTVRWLIDDEVIEEDTLQPNSTRWLVGAKWKKATTGTHVIKIIIDVNNDISETNENDNEYAIKFKR